jgi:hypothetical protein
VRTIGVSTIGVHGGLIWALGIGWGRECKRCAGRGADFLGGSWDWVARGGGALIGVIDRADRGIGLGGSIGTMRVVADWVGSGSSWAAGGSVSGLLGRGGCWRL